MQRRHLISSLASAPLSAALAACATSGGPGAGAGGSAAASPTAADAPPRLPRGAHVLFQGDSITDGGRRREGRDQNHIFGQSYPLLTMARVCASHPEMGWRFSNRGIGGNTVADLTARWDTDTLALQPDVLSILIGINESFGSILGGDKPIAVPVYESTYDALLARTRAALPRVQLLLCEPFTLPVGQVMRRWPEFRADVDARRQVVARLAERHGAVFVPLQAAFDRAAQRAPGEYWIFDGIHPTPAGHQVISDAWLQALATRR